jgi:hypothetical protein
MTLAALTRRLSKFAIDNSPTILTTVGVVGAVTTAYLTGKASFQAAGMIHVKEALDDERGKIGGNPREVLKERVELVWKLYIPPALMGAATMACIIGANQIGNRRYAALGAATTIIERGYEEYAEKVKEKLGERKEAAIRDEVAQDRVNATYIDGIKIRGLDQGEICYDMFGGQYFYSTVERIQSVVNLINASLNHDGTATLGDFYRHLDMDVPAFSETLGWNSDRLMDVRISSTVLHETKPCLTVSFRDDPLPDYGRSRFR